MAKKDDISNLTIEELMQLLAEKQNQMAQEKSNNASEDDDPDETVIYSDDEGEEIMLEESDSEPVNISDDDDEEEYEEYDDDEDEEEEEDEPVTTVKAQKTPEYDDVESPDANKEKGKIESNLSSGKKYLKQALISEQMGGYANDVWEHAEADYRELRRGSYPHVFSPRSDVSFGGNEQFGENLKRYRAKEASHVKDYKKNLSVIKENYKKHSADIAQNVAEKIKEGRRKGTALSWLSMILGIALGAVLFLFAGYFGMGAEEAGALTMYKYYRLACYIGLGLAGGSFIFNVLFLIIGHKVKLSGKKKEGVITIYDPVTWKKIKHKCEYKPRYKGRLWISFIVLILVLAISLGGGYCFLKGFMSGEYNLSDEGYLFSLEHESAYYDPVAYIEGVQSFSDSEESLDNKGYYEVTVPSVVTLDGVEYEVVGLKENAFRNNEAIISLKIGSNIRSIETGALQGCKNLRKLTFEDNLKLASDAEIARFFGLKGTLTISDDVKIREYVPKALKTVEYSNVRSNISSVCNVPANVFANLIDVQKITVTASSSNSSVTVGSDAYLNCKSLKKIDLPMPATFNHNALKGCTGLEELTLAKVSAGNETMSGFGAIFGNEIPSSLERVYVEGRVEDYAFYNCTTIKVVDCRNSSYIGDYAFGNCTSLIEVLYDSDNCTVRGTAFDGSSLAD